MNTQKLTLPDPTFKSTTTTWDGRLIPFSNISGGEGLDDAAIESTPLKDIDWATLFAYMHRRFGPPHLGGDDYKDLSAGWVLTTKDDQTFVVVSPSLSGPKFSFRPHHLAPFDDTSQHHELKLSPARTEVVKEAFRSTLLDLLRPACIRDQFINAMGEMGDSKLDQALLRCNEDADNSNAYITERHASSGYPTPLGLFGGEDWAVLCEIIKSLGEGNIKAGRAAVISALRSNVCAEATKQPRGVKRLMLMAHYSQRQVLAEALTLSNEELAEFSSELAILSGDNASRSTVIKELTMEDVEAAIKLLSRLGLRAHGLKTRVNRLLLENTVAEAYDELLALPSDDFPESSIPLLLHDASRETNLAEYMRTFYLAHDRKDLAGWIDSTMSKPNGLKALSRIAKHIQEQLQKPDGETPDEQGQ